MFRISLKKLIFLMFAAMNLKKRVILIYSLLSLILVSCAKEDTANWCPALKRIQQRIMEWVLLQ